MEKPKKCVQQDSTKGKALKRGALMIFVWVTTFLAVISFLMESRWDIISSNLSLLVMAIAMLNQPLKASDFVLVTHQSAKPRTDQQETENIMAIEGGGRDSNEYRYEYINKKSIALYESGDLDLGKKLPIEKHLIAEYQSGDPRKSSDALEIILNHHHRIIYRQIKNKVKDEEVAQNVMSDLYVVAAKKLKTFEWQDIPLKHWFRSAAKIVCAHHLGKEAKKEIKNDEMIQKLKNKQPEVKTLEEELIEKEEQQQRDQQVIKACNMLKNKWQRKIVMLKYFREMSNKEIAEELGKSENAIRTDYGRAIKKLKKYFKEHGIDSALVFADE